MSLSADTSSIRTAITIIVTYSFPLVLVHSLSNQLIQLTLSASNNFTLGVNGCYGIIFFLYVFINSSLFGE